MSFGLILRNAVVAKVLCIGQVVESKCHRFANMVETDSTYHPRPPPN